ncbi:hypothetical protein JCM16303_006033 [Sporobolomyces ruberrimus]
MCIPEGINGYDGKVPKLDRALYGLKQAGRAWNHRIDATLRALGYTKTKSDACVYVRQSGEEHHYIALYVDDLLFVSKSIEEITRCKDGLREEYGIRGSGKATFILGIQIHGRGDRFISLSMCVPSSSRNVRTSKTFSFALVTLDEPLADSDNSESSTSSRSRRSRSLAVVSTTLHAGRWLAHVHDAQNSTGSRPRRWSPQLSCFPPKRFPLGNHFPHPRIHQRNLPSLPLSSTDF